MTMFIDAVKTIYCAYLFLLFSNAFQWENDEERRRKKILDRKAFFSHSKNTVVSRTFDTNSSPKSIDFQEDKTQKLG